MASLRLHAVINERLSHASMIAITHRVLPLVHLFSRVIAFEQGVCIEDASPSELLQQEHSQLHFLFEQVHAMDELESLDHLSYLPRLSVLRLVVVPTRTSSTASS